MKKIMMTVFFAVLTTFISIEPNAKNAWQRDGSQDRVTVYTKPVRGSDVPMVKAVTTIDASPEAVWKIVTLGNMKVRGLKERRQIGTCGDTCDLIYVRIGNFLIEDRHYVVKIRTSKMKQAGQTYYVRTWEKVTHQKLASKKAMEVKHIRGSWIVQPADDGRKTRLTYLNHLDLGGNIPPIFFTPKFVNKAYEILSHVRVSASDA